MWTELTVADRDQIDRYCQVFERSNGAKVSLPSIRSKIKRSGHSYYLFDNGAFAMSLCLGVEPRSGRCLLKNLSYTSNVTPAIGVPLLVSKLVEYAIANRIGTFYLIETEGYDSQAREAIQRLSTTPGVTVTQTPQPPGFFELKIELDVLSAIPGGN